ncbi:conserved protein [Tepidicaulis marinus]|uniref:Conserved protein n=1 Tax=Tepidicaulis marinus TaxID=1333998 RepID=A0A081B6E6_9HYPH|nr:3TM-type holin [Tepidicaulis marinus]GAK43614.1 conserved protein [Tepidicaulis marinus]
MEPVSLALGIAQFAAPALGRWLFGEKGEETAEKIIDVGKAVVGTDKAEDILPALKANPELLIRFQQQATQIELAELEAHTRQLEAVNETARAAINSDDKFVRRWRPTWGYVTAVTWALQSMAIMFCFCAAAVATLYGKAEAVTALMNGAASLAGALTVQWGVALTVLGVNVVKRSHDKQVCAGQRPGTMAPSAVTDLVRRVTGGARG